jgi:hypothetical protein
MKTRFFPILGLLALTVLSACAPAASDPIASLPTSADTQAAASPSTSVTPTASSSSPQAIPTSRGGDLEATDPNTVSLASGQLQLVEFFRFT